jgi:hypothetical protein
MRQTRGGEGKIRAAAMSGIEGQSQCGTSLRLRRLTGGLVVRLCRDRRPEKARTGTLGRSLAGRFGAVTGAMAAPGAR